MLRYFAVKVGDVTTAAQMVRVVVELQLLVVVVRLETLCQRVQSKLACSLPNAANCRVELNAKEFDEETGMYYFNEGV